MAYSVYWTSLAENSLIDETEFILLKWNDREVVKFLGLIDDVVSRLKENPFMGKPYASKPVYSFTVSKQTTLFYKVDIALRQIDILLLHNNLQNPEYLKKISLKRAVISYHP